MEELRLLTQFVTDNRRRADTEKTRRYNNAIDFLKSGKVATDAEMATAVGLAPGDTPYRMFKSRLRKKVLHSFLFVSLPSRFISTHNAAFISCALNQYCARFLLLIGERKLASSLAREGLEKALKFDFTDFIIFFSQTLRISAAMKGDDKNFEFYRGMCANAIATLQAEEKANALSEELTLEHYKHTVWSKSLLEIAEKYCDEIKDLTSEYNSYSLNITCYRIQTKYNYIRQNYTDALESWKSFEAYLLSQPFYNSARMAEALLGQLNCFVYLREYEKGLKVAYRCWDLFKKGTNNWFTFLEVYILLLLHNKQYAEAAHVHLEGINNKKFLDAVEETQVDRWELVGLYLSFIQRFILAHKPKSENSSERKIQNLLQYVPTQTKDKEGYNVSILIIQILWLIATDINEKVCEKIDALKVYAKRYLKGEENRRSKIFMEMLFIAEKHDFKYNEVSEGTAQLHKRLLELSSGASGKLIDGMEVISYPDAWQMILDLLEKKK